MTTRQHSENARTSNKTTHRLAINFAQDKKVHISFAVCEIKFARKEK